MPDIFDNMDFPSAVDRMMDIKHGHRRGPFSRPYPPVTRNAEEWRFSFNGAQVLRVSSPDGNLEYRKYSGNWGGISRTLEDNSKCQRGFRMPWKKPNMNINGLKERVTEALKVVQDFKTFQDDV